MGDRFHPKLNMTRKPIAQKYCEGKVKRTLKRELKVLEIVKREANVICNYDMFNQWELLEVGASQLETLTTLIH